MASEGKSSTAQKSNDYLRKRYQEVVESLTDEQVNEFKDAFNKFDVNGSKTISADELGPAMKALGHDPTKQELDDMVQLVDTDESNTIDFQEFLTLMALRIKQPFTEEEVMDAFLEFDEEETGLISEDTLRNMMTRILPHPMSEDDLQEMLDIAHPNEDGMIEYKNFVKKMFEV